MTSSGFLGEPQTLLKSLIRFDFSLIKHDQVNWEILSNLCGSSLKIFTVQKSDNLQYNKLVHWSAGSLGQMTCRPSI